VIDVTDLEIPMPNEGEGVNASSPGAQPGSSSAPAGGDQGSTGGTGEGRTLDNVYGELSRKYGKLNDRMGEVLDRFDKLSGMLESQAGQGQQPGVQSTTPTVHPAQGGVAQSGSPYGYSPSPTIANPASPVSQFGAPRPLSQYTDEQIQTAIQAGNLPPQRQAILQQELTERSMERKATEIVLHRERENELSKVRADSEAAAKRSFAALRTEDSEFSQRVARELKTQRTQFGEFPTDYFDVANRVAREMGIESTKFVQPGFIGGTEGGQGITPQEPEAQPALSDAELEAVAKRFEHTLPIKPNKDGKMERRKFNLDAIKESSKEYNAHKDLYRGKGLKG
jgi:hypothetical protein